MIYIVAGTNRLNSNSLKVSQILEKKILDQGEKCEIVNLADLPLDKLSGHVYGQPPAEIMPWIDKINTADGIIVVVPEYNGSMPGILKYFIDFWKYPESFEFRPVAFVGIGGMFGGLRPVEHLQQVFGYRNAFIYPERIFIHNVWKQISADGEIADPIIQKLLDQQTRGFVTFIKALSKSLLHANTKPKPTFAPN